MGLVTWMGHPDGLGYLAWLLNCGWAIQLRYSTVDAALFGLAWILGGLDTGSRKKPHSLFSFRETSF